MNLRSRPRGRRGRRVGIGAVVGVVLTALVVAVPAQLADASSDLSFTPPADITVPATSSLGATVSWAAPTVTDDETLPPNALTCESSGGLTSGSVFPIGTTTVTCSITDNDDTPSTVTHSFNVTVSDTDLAFTAPADISAPATSTLGAAVTFTTPTATDEDTPPAVSCASSGGLTSGSVFPIGTTVVNCTATDPDNTPGTVAHSFNVTVIENDTDLAITPGVDAPPAISSAPNTGTPVSFTVPTATDPSDGAAVPVTCFPASGSWFLPGATTVTCTATDSDDIPSSVSTTLTVHVYPPVSAPEPPVLRTATVQGGTASMTFDPPPYDGSRTITSYTATCASSDGKTSASATGPQSPLTVTGVSSSQSYSCSVTAKNVIGTSKPSNVIVTSVLVTCTNAKTCDAKLANLSSNGQPSEKVDVKGIPTDPVGTIELSVGPPTLACGSSAAVSGASTLTDTGFSPASTLTATVTLLGVATGPAEVCYSSPDPFLSVSNPVVPQPGTDLLLPCAAVGNQAPCVLSSTLSPIVVKILVRGGDPVFSVVVPTGRMMWPSTFPNGKVGAAYSSHLQSRGGKAPFHWKVASGKLPPGLTLSAATGAVAGKPTTKGTFKCVMQVTDSESPPRTANISVSITVN